MNKFFALSAAVALTLGFASCSSDNDVQPANGEGVSSITVSLPGQLNTRSFGDGYSATKLQYAVYDESNGNKVIEGEAEFSASSLSTTVPMTLANGKNYKIAFFATANDDVYTFDADNKNFKIDYTKMAEYNANDRDCFFYLHETGMIKGSFQQDVYLYRPLAQINWGTSDLTEDAVVGAYGKDCENLTTGVVIADVYTTYNFMTDNEWTESVSGKIDAEFVAQSRPDASVEVFPVDGYEYLSCNYVLVQPNQELVSATLTPYANGAALEPVNVTYCPVQANYRTNIYGRLLSADGEFVVEKKPAFEGSKDDIVINDASAQ